MGKRTGGTTPSLGTNRCAAGALATMLVLAASSAAACGDAERAAHSAADSGVVVAAASSSRGDAAARTVTAADAFSTTSENVQPPHGRAAPLTASARSPQATWGQDQEQPQQREQAQQPGQLDGQSTRSIPEWSIPAEAEPYTWQDGERTLHVWLDPSLEVRASADGVPQGDVVVQSSLGVIIRVDSEIASRGTASEQDPKAKSYPVFRSDSGQLMMLPGGVLISLDPAWNADDVAAFFERNSIDPDLAAELDYLPNGYFIETEPGFASLDLASALVAMPGVELAVPNWASELSTR
ncbi:hypothetical protein [Candidatus Poriferisodalis sp.]|uniref:hypothetical protein n=1 Tax=Candidatus Poriferisodalis sp. TaxID=3101277 RepID=UPI003AF61BF4